MVLSKKNIYSLIVVFAVWFVILLAHFIRPSFNPISWDTFGYYLYLPFAFIYHDLGLQHKEIMDHIFAVYHPSNAFYQATHAANDNWIMKYSMGMAILYSPGFFIAHLVAYLTDYPADGFSTPYKVAIVVNGVLFSFVGVWYLRKVLLEFFTDRISALVLVLIFFGTNYYQYAAFSSEMPHSYLFTFYVLILWNTILWHRYHRLKNIIALALLIGLATLARPTELLSLLIPLLWNVTSLGELRDKVRLLWTNYKNQLGWFVFILAAIGSLQVIYWKIYSGSFIYMSYVNPGEGFEFLHPYILNVLFSFRKGWFIYTPIMVFAVAGFGFVYKKNRRIFNALFIFFILNLYIISSWSCWWYAQSFGQRALVQSYAVMAIPLGFFVQWVAIKKLWLRLLFGIAMTFFVLLNIFQTWQMHHSILSSDRMTFAYYLKSFGQTKVDYNDKKLLLINRTSLWETKIEDSSFYNIKVLKVLDFDNQNKDNKNPHYSSKHVHSGNYSLKLDSTLKYLPSYRIPYYKLTNKYYAWIRVTFWVFPVHDLDETPVSLVITFQHKGKNYHFKSKVLNSPEMKKNLKLNQWNKVEMLYLTPEVRRKEDNLLIYIWNRGKKDIYFDDVKIEVLEPKGDN